MSQAHNAMLRGLNALYTQAPHISLPTDISDFLFFAASWSAWIIKHHKLEESVMFPAFSAVPGVVAGSLDMNVEQHQDFAEKLEEFHVYAKSTSVDEYSGARVRELLTSFAEPLRQHLSDEIEALWAMDSVPANTPEAQHLLDIYKQYEAEAGKQDRFVVAPMVLGLCDSTFEGGRYEWPQMPWGSRWIVHYVLSWRYAGAWRFLPSDTWGRPRALGFAGEGDGNDG